MPRRLLLYSVYTRYIPITSWSPTFSSNIYQVSAWYILLRTVSGQYTPGSTLLRVPVAIRGGKAAFFFLNGVCVWRRLAFRHSFRFLPGFAAPIKMCSCSWGNLRKSVKSSYRQTSVYMAGICSTQTEGYVPGIYCHPPGYISPTTWDRNQKISLIYIYICQCITLMFLGKHRKHVIYIYIL